MPRTIFSPGVIVSLMGMGGLMFTFVEGEEFIGGKLPLVIFFIVVICLGMAYELYPRAQWEDTFGEVDAKGKPLGGIR